MTDDFENIWLEDQGLPRELTLNHRVFIREILQQRAGRWLADRVFSDGRVQLGYKTDSVSKPTAVTCINLFKNRNYFPGSLHQDWLTKEETSIKGSQWHNLLDLVHKTVTELGEGRRAERLAQRRLQERFALRKQKVQQLKAKLAGQSKGSPATGSTGNKHSLEDAAECASPAKKQKR
ncbi:hypothetical protein WJX73_004112 [Symbiochloris irregularis]|uniref:Transposase n=1 Tax=Symbiochloris irregularis TaxID=706552 RepID=A0AAW1PV68_9CHLO